MNAVGGFMAGSIVAKLLLDKTGWNESIKSVDKDTRELAEKATKLGEAYTHVGKIFGLVGGSITGSLLAMVKKTADAGDAIFDMSQRTGIAAETLSGLKIAAEKSGTSLEGVSVGLRFLGRSMVAAAEGTEMSAEAFAALKISVIDAGGKLRPMQDVMLEVADRFARMEDGAEKTALAMKLFGRSGAELIPMLNLGSEGLRKQIALAERFGTVFSGEAASAADKFNDAIVDLKASISGLSITIGNALMPAVKSVIQLFAGLFSGINNIAREHLGLTKTVSELALSFGGAATAVGVALVAYGTLVKMLATLSVTLGTTRLAIMAHAAAWTVVVAAIGYYIIKLGEKAEAEALADTANENYWKTYERFRMKLLEVAKATGLNVYQFNELTAKYGENINMLALAIKRGDEGVAMQKAMAEAGAANVKEFERQRLRALGLDGVLAGLNTTVNAVADGMSKMADQTINATEAFAKMAAENIDELVTWLSPEATESLVDEFIAMGAELSAEATKAAQGIKKNAVDPLKHAFDGLYNDIATGLGDAFEAMIDGTKSFSDAFVSIWKSIKKAFFRILGEMVAGFLVNFVKKIIAGMSIIKALSSALGIGGKLLGAVGSAVTGVGGVGAAATGVLVTSGGSLVAAPLAAEFAGVINTAMVGGITAGMSSFAVLGAIGFAAVWLGGVFGRLFGKSAAEKWEEEFNARMKKKYGQDWTNPPRVVTIDQLRQVPPPTAPITFTGRKKPTDSSLHRSGTSGDINVTLHVSTLDGADVAKVVRNKVIPVIREAARRREFWIPIGSAGGV